MQIYQERLNRVQSELDNAVGDMKKHLNEYRNGLIYFQDKINMLEVRFLAK